VIPDLKNLVVVKARMALELCWSMQILIRAVCIRRDLLNEQDLRTSTPQRWCKEQLSASTMLVWPLPFAEGQCGPVVTPGRRA
jgi:hypothetical protein